MGMGCLQSRRRGARKSDTQQHDCKDELCGKGRPSLWRRLPGCGFSRAASRIRLAEALAARHEGRPLDGVFRGAKGKSAVGPTVTIRKSGENDMHFRLPSLMAPLL